MGQGMSSSLVRSLKFSKIRTIKNMNIKDSRHVFYLIRYTVLSVLVVRELNKIFTKHVSFT